MSLIQMDRLSRETQHKSYVISKLEDEIYCLKNDVQTQKQLISKIQDEKNQLKKEIQTIKRKKQEQLQEIQNTENRFLLVLQKLQSEVEEGKKKFNKLNNKLSPMIDYDTVRLSVMTELNQQHDIELDKCKHTIEIQKDQIQKLKRENSLLQHKIQCLKMDYQQKIRLLNNSVKNQSSQNQLSLLSLEMSKQMENRITLSYETARKQAEYYKEKYFSTQKKYKQKITELQRELRNLKQSL